MKVLSMYNTIETGTLSGPMHSWASWNDRVPLASLPKIWSPFKSYFASHLEPWYPWYPLISYMISWYPWYHTMIDIWYHSCDLWYQGYDIIGLWYHTYDIKIHMISYMIHTYDIICAMISYPWIYDIIVVWYHRSMIS